MAHIIHTSTASLGVTSATTSSALEAKHTLDQYREEIVKRAPLLDDAVVIYKITRLPSRVVYAGNNTVTIKPIVKGQ